MSRIAKQSHLSGDDLAEALIERVRRKPSQRALIKRLAEAYGVTKKEIEKSFATLEDWGYHFHSGAGWRQFRSAPDALLATELRHKFKCKTLGVELHTYSQVKSTIDIARRLAEHNAPEGTLVIADRQTSGRGRLGRKWHSPPGVGAYLSLILRPKIEPALAPALSLVVGLAYCEALERVTGLNVSLKWPNDALIRRRKVAGVLTELATRNDRINYVIASIGMNLNHRRENFPPDLREKATSPRIAARHKVSRVEIVREFLYQLEKRYLTFLKSGFCALRKPIIKRSTLIGKEITISEPPLKGRAKQDQLVGRAVDIDETGRLVVETSLGKLSLLSGEVTLQGEY